MRIELFKLNYYSNARAMPPFIRSIMNVRNENETRIKKSKLQRKKISYTTYRLHSLSSVGCRMLVGMFRAGEAVIGFGIGTTRALPLSLSVSGHFLLHTAYLLIRNEKNKNGKKEKTRCCTLCRTIKHRTDSMLKQKYKHKLVPFVFVYLSLTLRLLLHPIFLLFFHFIPDKFK